MNININKVTPVIDGPILSILSHARKLGIADEINSRATRNDKKIIISTGMGIKAIIANILTDRKALHKIQDFMRIRMWRNSLDLGLKLNFWLHSSACLDGVYSR